MLTEFRQRKLRHLFNFYDVNRDGRIGPVDFELAASALLAEYGADKGSVRTEAIRALFAEHWRYLKRYMDTDKDDSLSYKEFSARYGILLQQEESTETLAYAKTDFMFQLIDSDGDGVINRNEYVNYLCAHGVSPSGAERSFDQLDHDLSGTLTRDEVLNAAFTFLASEYPELPGNWLFGPLA